MRLILALVVIYFSIDAWAATELRIERFQSTKTRVNTEYALYVPPPTRQTNVGLVVWFHGDGGASGYADAARQYGPSLAKYHLATLAIRAPQGQNWHDVPDVNTIVADELITEIMPRKLRLDKRRIVLAGASGGSVFISGMLLPSYGFHYAGGAVLLCGGAPSLRQIGAGGTRFFNQSAELAKKFRLYFKVQKNDYIRTQSREAATYYEGLGFNVAFDEPAGGSHCGFDLGDALVTGVQRVLKS